MMIINTEMKQKEFLHFVKNRDNCPSWEMGAKKYIHDKKRKLLIMKMLF